MPGFRDRCPVLAGHHASGNNGAPSSGRSCRAICIHGINPAFIGTLRCVSLPRIGDLFVGNLGRRELDGVAGLCADGLGSREGPSTRRRLRHHPGSRRLSLARDSNRSSPVRRLALHPLHAPPIRARRSQAVRCTRWSARPDGDLWVGFGGGGGVVRIHRGAIVRLRPRRRRPAGGHLDDPGSTRDDLGCRPPRSAPVRERTLVDGRE